MKFFNEQLEKTLLDILYYDKQNAIENIIQIVFEAILKAERSLHLSEDNSNNKANGYYKRIVKCLNKHLQINIPRDRFGLFKPVFLELLKDKESEMYDLAFELYRKGLTTRDISDVFKNIYNKRFSASSVSKITKEFEEERKAWQNKSLNEEYYFVYVDAIFIPVRRDTVENEAFYAVIGVKKDLKREILGLYNIPTESASGWREVLIDLRTRGVKKVLMFIADGICGFETVVKEIFPCSYLQKCLLHKLKNIMLKVRASDKAEISADFKAVFKLEEKDYTVAGGRANLDLFIRKWEKKYSWIKNKVKPEHIENYFAYLYFPASIHRMIYTTNWVERLNKGIRRTQKMRNSFPNVDSALNLICAYLMDFEERVYKYPVTSFLKVQDILDKKLEDYSFSDT